ncbi:phage baseplate upper protein [Streptococcus uberis]|nr:BppU family phage baseplate upper protein [Streptococcus uberis]MCK1254381.1 phage baseplate upper protein [Streptococcus uberis]
MSLDNFRNRTIIWDTVNKDFPQPIQTMQGDVNARTLLIKIVDNGTEIDLTGHSLRLTYQYTHNSNSGFIVIPPKNLTKGEFILVIPTEMTTTGVIEANLILLNESLEQVIVSKNLTFISDNSTVTDLVQEVNNKIDDFTKLLFNQTDLENLQSAVNNQSATISTKVEQSDLLITNKNVTTAQATANQAKTDAQAAMTKATEAQANSLPLNGIAVSASKLATPRKLGVNLQSSEYQYFDGTADATNIGVSGVLPIANGGTATNDGVINTIAYANSADGTDGFTTVYPNLNLLNNTRITQANLNSGYWRATGGSLLSVGSNNGIKVINNGGAIGSAGGFSYGKPTNVNAGDAITLSCFVKNIGTVEIKNFSLSMAFYGTSNSYPAKGNLVVPNDGKSYFFSLTVIVPSSATTAYPRWFDIATAVNEQHIFEVYGMKLELGSVATPYMPSASEVTIADYPKYVGFSNIIKPNKTNSDYKWLPMGLVSIDRATGLLKPAVMGIDYAQAHPVGSVVTNTSSSSSGYSTGTWENIGSAVIGSTTIYYWKRTA